jgi:predicted glycogen debranching enzyme
VVPSSRFVETQVGTGHPTVDMDTREWLEADGLGGFASGTVSTVRTRRYHGWLLHARTPPTGRTMLVAGLEAWVECPDGRLDLIAQRYAPATVHPGIPDARFARDPWPAWHHALPWGGMLTMEVFVAPGRARTWIRWRLDRVTTPMTLHVRPLLATRDYHGLQCENGAASLSTLVDGNCVQWQLYADSLPAACRSGGTWRQEPTWYRQFHYAEEAERGLDAVEDLVSPGVLSFHLSDVPAVVVFGTPDALADLPTAGDDLVDSASRCADAERRRREALGDRLARAADSYIVQRSGGCTIIAGYPWFTDWGRDTFIAMRGLCLATGRLSDARDILLAWTASIDDGMLPNRFPDAGDAPEYNSVDAALWFVVVCGELLNHPEAASVLTPHDRRTLEDGVMTILQGHIRGTRHGIGMDADGLLRAGVPGQQLTWMDARVDGREITPRIGKPVEIQALWINGLATGAAISGRWSRWVERARAAFDRQFAHHRAEWLPDVVDADHVRGRIDWSLRPNQVLALGGLPVPLVTGDRARAIVDRIEAQLWTPLGLRSLAPGEQGYAARYEGSPHARDAVYHQGTVWPWLMGPFVDAWVRVRGSGIEVQREARRRFLAPVLAHLDEAGLDHVSEIADGDAPHRPRGCPFQAWSLGEVIRLDRSLARGATSSGRAPRRAASPES